MLLTKLSVHVYIYNNMFGLSSYTVPGTETETKSTPQTETKPTDTQPASNGRIQAKGPDENGVNPVITEVDRESEASVAVGGQSEHRDEDVPAINGHNDEAVEEAGERRGEATESGVEEVGRSRDLQKEEEEEENPVTEETGEEEVGGWVSEEEVS